MKWAAASDGLIKVRVGNSLVSDISLLDSSFIHMVGAISVANVVPRDRGEVNAQTYAVSQG